MRVSCITHQIMASCLECCRRHSVVTVSSRSSSWYACLSIALELLCRHGAEVETDPDGVDPNSLRAVLESWPAEKPRPRVMYTVPVSLSHRRSECVLIIVRL